MKNTISVKCLGIVKVSPMIRMHIKFYLCDTGPHHTVSILVQYQKGEQGRENANVQKSVLARKDEAKWCPSPTRHLMESVSKFLQSWLPALHLLHISATNCFKILQHNISSWFLVFLGRKLSTQIQMASLCAPNIHLADITRDEEVHFITQSMPLELGMYPLPYNIARARSKSTWQDLPQCSGDV